MENKILQYGRRFYVQIQRAKKNLGRNLSTSGPLSQIQSKDHSTTVIIRRSSRLKKDSGLGRIGIRNEPPRRGMAIFGVGVRG